MGGEWVQNAAPSHRELPDKESYLSVGPSALQHSEPLILESSEQRPANPETLGRVTDRDKNGCEALDVSYQISAYTDFSH